MPVFSDCEMSSSFACNLSELAKELSVTVSFGVADNANVTDYDRLLSHADTALYHAKNNGRNKVVIYNKEILIL